MRRQIGARHLNAQISNWLLLFLLIDFFLMVSIPHIHHIIILILIKLLRLPPRVLQTVIVTLVFLIIFLTVVELIHSLWGVAAPRFASDYQGLVVLLNVQVVVL